MNRSLESFGNPADSAIRLTTGTTASMLGPQDGVGDRLAAGCRFVIRYDHGDPGHADAGVLLAGEGLHPSAKGARVRFSGTKRTVVDGPFVETKELIAGFWLIRVASMAEAIAWVKRCPNPTAGESEIEIRQIFEADDFGPAFTPELREAEARLREKASALG